MRRAPSPLLDFPRWHLPIGQYLPQQHYAHLAPSYVADTIRTHFPTLGISDENSVVPIDRKA